MSEKKAKASSRMTVSGSSAFVVISKIGEWLEISGNGQIRVTTHAGLVVTLSIRDRSPKMAVKRALVDLLESDKRKKAPLYRRACTEHRTLVRRGYATVSSFFGLLRITRKGRIAAKRFAKVFAGPVPAPRRRAPLFERMP